MKKKCGTCKIEKDISEFNKKRTGHQSYCKKCQKIYKDQHYKDNSQRYKDKTKQRKTDIREWVQNYKQGLKCEKCQEDRWYVLDFHHKDPETKELCISECVGNKWSIKRIQKEIAKCAVLCRNCHQELHYFEQLENKEHIRSGSRRLSEVTHSQVPL